MKSNKKNILQILLPLTCFFCNISQLPDLWGNRFISLIYKGLFVLILLYCVFQKTSSVNIPTGLFSIFVAFILFLLIASIINNYEYLSSNLLSPILLCVFILFTSYQAGELIDDGTVKRIAYSYVLSAGILVVFIFRDFFSGVDWLNASGYIYTAKNSVAVIFMISIVLTYYYIFQIKKTLAFLIFILFSFMIFMLKSRATLFTWIIFIVYILCIAPKSKAKRWIGLLICCSAVIFVMYNGKLNEMIIKNVLLNNRTADINTLTSGRDVHYDFFKKNFSKYWLLGNGGKYLESFPLAALFSYGVIGAIPVFLLSFYPILILIKNKSTFTAENKITLIIFILNVLLWFNGLFEELTPFGPGVKCYMLWMLTGLYMGMLKRGKYNGE